MNSFQLTELLAERTRRGRPYLEFLRVPALSAGLYVLPAGGTDRQEPHGEAEVYYLVAGRGEIAIGDASHPVAPGSVIFVPAGVPHRFHSLTEELRALVFFAPAETVPPAAC